MRVCLLEAEWAPPAPLRVRRQWCWLRYTQPLKRCRPEEPERRPWCGRSRDHQDLHQSMYKWAGQRTRGRGRPHRPATPRYNSACWDRDGPRSEEHTSELQSRLHLVCRLLLEKKKIILTVAAARGNEASVVLVMTDVTSLTDPLIRVPITHVLLCNVTVSAAPASLYVLCSIAI